MSSHTDHDPGLDALGASLRAAPAEPPAAFMGAVRRRRRRLVIVRAAGTFATAAVIVLVALAIALPVLRRHAAPTPPIVHNDRPQRPTGIAIVPTVANLHAFMDDPKALDHPGPSGPVAEPVRAGDRPDADSVRRLLTLP